MRLLPHLLRPVDVLRLKPGGISDDGYATPIETLTKVATVPMSIQANRQRIGSAAPGSVLATASYLAYCAPHPEITGTGFTLRAADGALYEPEADALDIGGQGRVLLIPLKAPQGREA